MPDLSSQISAQEKEFSLAESLQIILLDYLEKRPHISVAAIAHKCNVSEPTLRRIKNKQFRKAPTYSTVLSLLTYLENNSSVQDLIDKYPGPIAEYLTDNIPQNKGLQVKFDTELNSLLKDNTTYGVFKLCSNRSGLSIRRAQRLFGEYGIHCLKSLESKGYVKSDQEVYFSNTEWFILDPSQISEKFKFLSNYIKPLENPMDPHLRAIQASYSCSVNEKAYKSIAKLKTKYLEKVREIMADNESEGSIPMILISALDTFDTKSVHENFLID